MDENYYFEKYEVSSKKRKDSSKSKSSRKSNHKHHYENVLFIVDDDKDISIFDHYPYLYSRCSICGKLGYDAIEDEDDISQRIFKRSHTKFIGFISISIETLRGKKYLSDPYKYSYEDSKQFLKEIMSHYKIYRINDPFKDKYALEDITPTYIHPDLEANQDE